MGIRRTTVTFIFSNDDTLILSATATGSHTELFGK